MGISRKVVLNAVLALAALLVGAGGYFGLAALKEPPEPRPRVEKTYNIEVFDVERLDLQEVVSSFGTARADREVTIAAQVNGEIVEVHPRLEVGYRVSGATVRVGPGGESQRSPGDLLVRIDPKTYQERVLQAEKQLAQDEAELSKLEQEEHNNRRMLEKAEEDFSAYQEEFNRVKSLRNKNVVSPSDLTRALLELRQYEDSLIKLQNEKELFPLRRAQLEQRRESHRTDLEVARLDLQRTEVRPPFDGTLSEVTVEQGQFVRAGDELVRLTDTSQVEIPLPVTLSDYAKLEPIISSGSQPRAILAENETAPGQWFGYVVRAAPVADELTRTINVYIQVDNSEQKVPLLPGTFVHARIDGPILEDTIVVPRDAISSGRLFIANEVRAEARSVQIERNLQMLAIIKNGLIAGESVILTNLDVIYNGAKVSIQSHRNLAEELQRQRTEVARPVLAGGAKAAGEESMN